MNQLLLGASIPFAVAACVYVARRARASLPLLVATPCAMAALAVWAVAPDLPRLVGLHRLYLKLAADPRIDIFLWHYTIDAMEIDSPAYGVGLAALAAALLAAAWRELRLREGDQPWST